jgi:hypothetical protein
VELDILRRREKSSWSASSGFTVGRDTTTCGDLLLRGEVEMAMGDLSAGLGEVGGRSRLVLGIKY